MTSGVADRNAARSASAALSFVARRVAATEAVISTARFTAGRDAGNRLDPDGPVETRLVMTDSLIGDWHVADMKLHVESVEIDVLRGCTRAVRPPHRTDPARMERDVVIGARSQPAPSDRSARTTQLSAIPAQPTGTPAARHRSWVRRGIFARLAGAEFADARPWAERKDLDGGGQRIGSMAFSSGTELPVRVIPQAKIGACR
jgi:hypothetical protein